MYALIQALCKVDNVYPSFRKYGDQMYSGGDLLSCKFYDRTCSNSKFQICFNQKVVKPPLFEFDSHLWMIGACYTMKQTGEKKKKKREGKGKGE